MQGKDQTAAMMGAGNQEEQTEREHVQETEKKEISLLSSEQEEHDQPKRNDQPEQEEHDQSASLQPLADEASSKKGFDWIAVSVVGLIALFFAIVACLNPQVPTSLTPIAVLSASGCGLLITALRKLRTPKGLGLLEAAVGGFLLALFPFLAAITAPYVLTLLRTDATEQQGFLITWTLIAVFSILFSLAGAALGHLAFAPLRPLPAKSNKTSPAPATEAEEAPSAPATEAEEAEIAEITEIAQGELPVEEGQQQLVDENSTEEDQEQEVDEDSATGDAVEETAEPARSLVSYLITVVLLGLTPTIAGYVFSAAYDYLLTANQFLPGPYPTLRLLSTVLPWQVPVAIDLSGSGAQATVFLVWQFWRIPLFLGNPTMFDVVALEPYMLNGAALLLLLLFSIGRSSTGSRDGNSSTMGLPVSLLLEAVLGLLIALPPALWIARGLEGLLQLPTISVPIRTLYLLNPLTLTLNLITGPLVCLLAALVLRLFQSKPRT